MRAVGPGNARVKRIGAAGEHGGRGNRLANRFSDGAWRYSELSAGDAAGGGGFFYQARHLRATARGGRASFGARGAGEKEARARGRSSGPVCHFERAGDGSLEPCGPRTAQQANRGRFGHQRAHGEAPSNKHYPKTENAVCGRANAVREGGWAVRGGRGAPSLRGSFGEVWW